MKAFSDFHSKHVVFPGTPIHVLPPLQILLKQCICIQFHTCCDEQTIAAIKNKKIMKKHGKGSAIISHGPISGSQ